MKKYFWLFMVVASNLQLFGQNQAPSFILNKQISGQQEYQASQYIDMINGFGYKANTKSDVFHAKIDPFMVFPPEEGEFGGPNADDKGVVGSIAGVFDVTSFGQASYTIPIQIPNDFNGLMPSLALTYTSQSSNGLLGIGWNLAGISSVSRTGSTVYHDGLTKGIRFDETDNFILDGQRLMKVSDLPNGSNNCEYRTEQETFNRVFSKQPTIPIFLNGPESFVVIKKDGSKWHYGSTENSRMEQELYLFTTNYLWLLDRVEDVKGNYIEYSYTKYNNSGEIYVDAIRYTGFSNTNGNVNITPNYEIKFRYVQRLDKEISFIRDIRRESSQILEKILIKKQPENKNLFTYVMNYVFDGKYNCLRNVTLTDEFGNSYNPLSFNWIKPEIHPSSVETILGLDKSFLFPGDFNGDGFTDFLQLPELTDDPYSSNDKLKLILNTKNGGFITSNFERALSPNFSFVKVCDIDGDLISDFLYCEINNNGSFQITPYKSNGNSGFTMFEPIIYTDYLTSASSYSIGDFLGLGKSGLLIKRAWTINSIKHYAWKIYYYNNSSSNTMNLVGEGVIDNWGSINMEGDFNGDGLTDIMVVNELNTKIYSFKFDENSNLIPVHFYNSGFPTADWHRVFTGDFNGDGRTDVLTYNISGKKWEIAYFKETGFDWPYISVNIPGGDPDQLIDNMGYYRKTTDYTHLVCDFDGNGKDDIVTLKYTPPTIIPPQYLPPFETHIDIAYIHPNNMVFYETDKFVSETRFLRKTTQIGDFYGKGKADILISKSVQNLRVYDEYGNWILRNVSFPTILKTYDRYQYVITVFDDGLDNIINVDYDKLTSSDVYTNTHYGDFGSGIYDITIPLNVVKRTTVEMVPAENQSHVKIENFKYEGLKFHNKGKGLLGFTKLIASDNISNVISVKTDTLNNNNVFLYPYSNATYYQQPLDENLLSKQTFNFSRAVYRESIPRVFMMQLNSQLNHLYEEAGVFKKTELIEYTYDNYEFRINPIYKYGNVTNVKQSISKEKLYEHHNSYEYISETSYTYNDDSDYTDLWLVSLVEDTKTNQSSNEEGSVTIKNETTNLYYPKSNTMGFPFIWKTIEKPDEDENHLLSVEKVFSTFDLRGNILSSTTTAPHCHDTPEPRSSSIEYSDDYDYRFPTSTTNALLNVATSTYDPVYGTLKTSTGPNGLTTHYDSNPLGTFSKTTSPDGIISTTVSRWAFGHAHAPENAYYFSWQQTSGSPEVMIFYHKTGVELRSVTFGFDGSAIYVDKFYNSKGLLQKESLPYKKGAPPHIYRVSV